MREIKFRAWNPKKQSMSPSHSLAGWVRVMGGELKLDLDKEVWVMMQFTGLKDKNGKEIYEGDLLHSHTKRLASPEKVLAVKYSGSGFIVYSPSCCEACRDGRSGVCPLDDYDNWEVIGNIYENAELLS